MGQNKTIPLTVGEISALWNGFNSETMSLYVYKHFEGVVDDVEIKSDIQTALQLFEKNSKLILEFFKAEEHPIPVGFTERDVNLKAPFSDKMILEIILTVIRFAITFYGEALAISTRRDLFAFYNKTIPETTLYANKCVELEIELGYLEEQPKATDHDDLINKNH